MPNDSGQSLRIPSQVFKWFEKMKGSYDNSVQSVLNRFEEYTKNQQARIDDTNKNYVDDIKASHLSQLNTVQETNKALRDDINYYKQQIALQQQTIEQLNTRYDAVMSCLIKEKSKHIDINTLFNDNFLEDIQPAPTSNENINSDDTNTTEFKEPITTENNNEAKPANSIHEHDNHKNVDNTVPLNSPANTNFTEDEQEATESKGKELFTLAIQNRNQHNFEAAFALFKESSTFNFPPALGAMGRSYFLGEGIEENHELGLAWLIKAAKLALPQAIARVKQFEKNEPELYKAALYLVENSKL